MIRVVIIDDSAFMRKAIQIMVESDPEIQVVGMARDGAEGVEMVRNLKPDCITLDLEMPRMNGLEALDIIMRDTPTPTLVVSSISTEGAEITLEALDRGAMDYIPKTQSFVAIDITSIKDELLRKIKSIVAHAPTKRRAFMDAIQRRRNRAEALENSTEDGANIPIKQSLINKDYQVLAMGVSTGGPPVVQYILENLPGDFPVGVMVAQHMPEVFTKPFAERLNKLSPLNVKEAEHGETLEKGTVLIGKGGQHMVVQRKGNSVIVDMSQRPEGLLYYPSADLMFSSLASVFGEHTLGVILTGMGHDGLLGLRDTNKANGTIIAQNEETCVIYGMPKAVVDDGIADIVASAAHIPNIITRLVQ
ncbi:MAG: chemotaxis response regulator protein-glutamate methylesterase [Candidatus Marinimicrobia bacterium]|nr:chemotaxis response regulator protein-glutamate methylesterase [Candidatus Neomarinimicrobiota bacterium]